MDRRTTSSFPSGAALVRTTLAVGLAGLLAGCAGLSNAQSRDTLAPLPPPGVALAAPTIPVITATQTTPTAPTGPVADDDTNPLSIAGRFLSAAATGNADVATQLAVVDRDPSVASWASDYHDSIVAVAGPDAWGAPACAEPANSTTSCTWLLTDPTTSLVLVEVGGEWRVSHPLQVPAGEGGVPVGTACVIGDQSVRVRGGPGTNWPRFTEVPAGRCGVEFFAPVLEGPQGPWRLVRVDGQLGWIVERVLRAS